MKTKNWAIALMVMTTIFTSTAQIFYKLGAQKLEFNIIGILTNYHLFIGLAIYATASVMMITAFKGGELSALYPIIATSYIWVGVLSIFIFQEALSILRWLGILTIFLGVIFVGIGSKHTKGLEGTAL
ncbi:hypothetical protein J4401_04825 [Candidatus Woesearchaeota archaeon]|nr:hypothetical protein [Candidatus Woesearchaeota archaeon]